MKNVMNVLNKDLLDMPTFRVILDKQLREEAEKMAKYKGMKCDLKPSSMELNVVV